MVLKINFRITEKKVIFVQIAEEAKGAHAFTSSASKMKPLVYVVGCLFKFVPLFARDFMACFM